MIFLNDEQISPQDLAKKLGVDLKKITKHGIFELNKKLRTKDKLNGGQRVPAGKNILCYFWAKGTDGKSFSLRYAESVNPREVGDKVIMDYAPKKIMFPGEEFIMVLEADKALFMFLAKDCIDSPFYIKGRPFYYYLQDREKEAKARVETLTSKTRAYSYVTGDTAMDMERQRTLAKGLGVSGIDNMEDYEVQDALMQLADKDAEVFIMNAKSKNTEFYGTIQNVIDKGGILFKNINGVDRWYWGSGPLNTQEIIHIEKGADAFETLKNHIVNNAESLFKMIYDLSNGANTDDKLNKFFQSQEEEEQIDIDALNQQRIADENAIAQADALKKKQSDLQQFAPPSPQPPTDIVETPAPAAKVVSAAISDDPMPTTFQEAVAYLTKKNGETPKPAAAKLFFEQCQERAAALLKEGKE